MIAGSPHHRVRAGTPARLAFRARRGQTRPVTPVDRVRAIWCAFESGGALATLEHVHDDFEVPSPGFPEGEPIQGTGAVRALLEELSSEGVRLEPILHSCEAVGDHVLVSGRLRVVSRAALADSPLFWVYRLRDERVARVESYPSRRDALAAA